MKIKNIIEVLIHSSPKPLKQADLNYVLSGEKKVKLEKIIDELNRDYKKMDKGFYIEKISGGYQLLSRKEYIRLKEETVEYVFDTFRFRDDKYNDYLLKYKN